MLKGPIPFVVVFLFTMLIKNLCALELIFTVKPQGLNVFLDEIRQCIYLICDSLLTNQMTLSFNINILILLEDQNKLSFLTGKKSLLLHKTFYFQVIFSYINERNTPSHDCIHKHMLENGAPPDKFGVFNALLHIEFHGRCVRVITLWFLVLTQFLHRRYRSL